MSDRLRMPPIKYLWKSTQTQREGASLEVRGDLNLVYRKAVEAEYGAQAVIDWVTGEVLIPS